jgi:(p)ppGpp synthase/HD superfamily hydrolase
MEAVLQKIQEFADRAHDTQQRKYSPDRYIVHPIRVMETCRKYNPELPILAAALLHDVVEDTPVGYRDLFVFLRSLMSEPEARKTVSLVEELTDVYVKSDYPQLNRRRRKDKELERVMQTSPEAQTIKYADIIDNSTEIVAHDPGFAQRYLSESLAILRKAGKGDQELHHIALKTVEGCLHELKNLER